MGVGTTKPDLDLFLTALNQLQVGREAVNRAGIFVVAVPNPVTSLLAFEGANLILNSFSELPLITLPDTVQ